jgi:hypothetical protein
MLAERMILLPNKLKSISGDFDLRSMIMKNNNETDPVTSKMITLVIDTPLLSLLLSVPR